MTQPPQTDPQTETLKENEYKLVERIFSNAGSYVVKTFRGHSPANCRRNARHTFDSLALLKAQFSDVLCSPNVVSLDDCSVSMEFLDGLPDARQLEFATLSRAAPFFRRCYEVEVDRSVLWSIEDSVHVTPKILDLMRAEFPVALGFKGDLYENLRVSEEGLILADSETASVEPLGLSELILYVFMVADSLSSRQLSLRTPRCAAPVAFAFLDRAQREALVHAALEFCRKSMSSTPGLLRYLKLKRSSRVLISML